MKKPKTVFKKLSGKKLANYIKENKESFQGDGDKLCLAAGYGKESNDGILKCDFPLFIKEFNKAVSIID